MRKRISLLGVILALLCCPSWAQIEPDRSTPVGQKEFIHEKLYVRNIYKKTSELTSPLAEAYNQDLSRVGVAFDNASLDLRSGRWGTLIPTTPLIPGKGRFNNLTWDAFGKKGPGGVSGLQETTWYAFVEYLQINESSLRVDVGELEHMGKVTVHNDGDLIQIYAPRQIDGIPVHDSYITAVVNHGNLILMGVHGWGDIDLNTLPSLDEQDARGVLADYLGNLRIDGYRKAAHLQIIPMVTDQDLDAITVGAGYDYRLAWTLSPGLNDPGTWEAVIDAHSGELLSFEDTTHYLMPAGSGSTAEVYGGAYPVSNDGTAPDGVEVEYPMPFTNVSVGGQTQFTDTGGNLPECVEGTISTSLSGLYIAITDSCGAVDESATDGQLDLGFGANPGDTDCTVAPGASPGNTKSARSAYYEINRMAEIGRAHLPNNPWLRAPLSVTVNINSNCNATGGAGGLNFFTSGGGCNNTGEIAGVFDHEWGHGMDASDATPGFSNSAEGIADIYASLRLNTSCIGRNFRLTLCPGYGDTCTECTGVREIDWRKHSSNTPHDITWIDNTCGAGGSTPCGGSSHCEGHVYSEAVWDLWNHDLQSEFGVSLDVAREIGMRLTFVGAGAVATWYQCSQGSGGCGAGSGYLNYIAADDDDGDLNNGTPHMTAIFNAFDRHGIACTTPTVQNSGCAGSPTAATTVTANAIDRGARLSWTAVPNATAYRIYRNESVFMCDFGKLPVAETTELSYLDTGLRNGLEYFYQVIPIGDGDTCFGPASNCASLMPVAGTNLSFSSDASWNITSGDSDPFVDNCEDVTLSFDVNNVGAGTAANVRVTAVRFPSHPNTMLTTSLPATVTTSLGLCEAATGNIAFIPEGLSFNDNLVVEIDVLSDGLTQPRTHTITIGGTESDLETVASLSFTFENGMEGWTVADGTFTRTEAGGGANGSNFYMASSAATPGQCDRLVSPIIVPTANTTLSLWNQFDIEGDGGTGTWYDRGNIALIDVATSERTVIEPDSGRLYNAGGTVSGSFCTNGESGFGGTMQTWAESSFSATALNASNIAGNLVQIDVRYATDSALHLTGLWVDEIRLTNVELQVADVQDNSCVVDVCADLTLNDWPNNGDRQISILDILGCGILQPPPVVSNPIDAGGLSGE